MATIIDGRRVSDEIYENLKPRIKVLKDRGVTPGLGVIMVGDKVESRTYVNTKRRKCEQLGIENRLKHYELSVTQQILEDQIQEFNSDPSIYGILVQLPLPDHIHKNRLFRKISPEKDVDAFSPANAGHLSQNDHPLFLPCTPRGCMTLLDFYGITVKGKNVTIIGCSNLVGLPLSLLLLHRGATVSICHILTSDVRAMTQPADIVIACCGSAHLVKEDWVKHGAVVVDVGINKVDDDTADRGYRLVGDVDFDKVRNKSSHITPVPGGVGPMTIAMLVTQLVESAERNLLTQS